jgi:succinate dehydrogenase/fumarate reductase flavoprotein subunit
MASPAAIRQWDEVADIVVAGYGLAGACAAIEAVDSDPNVEVLIVEKMPAALAGGNSRVSGQSLLISQDVDALVRYQRRLNEPNPVPEPMLQEWARRMVALEPWIEERAKQVGARYIRSAGWSDRGAILEFPDLGAREAVAFTATILPVPSGVWLAFKANVEQRRRIRVQCDSPVVDLVQDPDTLEVFGIVIEHQGRRKAVRARRGVVLAMGGFENNVQMQRDYFGLGEVRPFGTPGNTGDGIRLLQKAGADLWHLRNRGQSGGIWPGFRLPGQDTVFMRQLFFQTFSWIDVAQDGRRFCNETFEWQLTHYKERSHGVYVDTPHGRVGRMHMLFDETTRQANCLVTKVMTWNAVVGEYQWSDDNAAEIAQGWIRKADDIGALAKLIDHDPATLEATVRRYNDACARGVDEEFGRGGVTLQPLAKPPFYAIEVVPSIVCTGGGARRNIESEVLDHDGQPIRRLYEAGELGSMFSNLYQNGSYLTEAMISGRAAGRNAAALAAWE